MQKQELALCGANLKRSGLESFDSGDPKYCFVDLKRGSCIFKIYLKVS